MFDIGDFASASEYVGKEYSSLEVITHKVHVALPAGYFGKIKSAIAIILNNNLQSYSEVLQGMPVAFNRQNVKLLTPYGKIIADQSCVHIDVETEYVVFKPTVTTTLQGVVNKQLKHSNMVGCLVHGVFYASVNLEGSQNPGLGDEILFSVTKMEHDGYGYLALKGKFIRLISENPNKLEVTQKRKPENDSGIDDDHETSSSPSTDLSIPLSQAVPSEDIPEIASQSKRKKKKDKISDEKKQKKKDKKEKKKAKEMKKIKKEKKREKKEKKRMRKEKKVKKERLSLPNNVNTSLANNVNTSFNEIEPWPATVAQPPHSDTSNTEESKDVCTTTQATKHVTNTTTHQQPSNPPPTDYSSVDEAIESVVATTDKKIDTATDYSSVDEAITSVIASIHTNMGYDTNMPSVDAESVIAPKENIETATDYSSVDEAIDFVIAASQTNTDTAVKTEKVCNIPASPISKEQCSLTATIKDKSFATPSTTGKSPTKKKKKHSKNDKSHTSSATKEKKKLQETVNLTQLPAPSVTGKVSSSNEADEGVVDKVKEKKSSKKRKLHYPEGESMLTNSPKKVKLSSESEAKSEEEIAMAYLKKMGITVNLEEKVAIKLEDAPKHKKKKSKKSKKK
nr:nucleolar and coiled-body phosphoprotein 1 [Ciona intestinalis]|eukprot:XP_002126279.1 nucleolar and coiled-body phosphoprotein 1 [Ciona intestinalis]